MEQEACIDLTKYAAILFDLDGVLVEGTEAIPGAAGTIASLRAAGKRVGIVTNNARHSVHAWRQMLDGMGISLSEEEIITAPQATALWLAQRGDSKTAFVVGTDGLREELRQQGIRVIEQPELHDYKCEYLVVSVCPNVSDKLLTQALRVALQGAVYVAVHRDGVFPGQDGFYPGAGAMVGAVSGMLGREPDMVIGKPSPYMLDLMLGRFQVGTEQSLFVGDTLRSDIAMGRRAGMDTLLVLSGNGRLQDIAPGNEPTFVLPSVTQLEGCLQAQVSPHIKGKR